MSAELERRLELVRRRKFYSSFIFYSRSTDSVHFFKRNSFDVFVLEDCIMHGGAVK